MSLTPQKQTNVTDTTKTMSVMFQTLTNDETQNLKWELHSELPGSAKIYYVLCNHLDGLLTGFEVIVDQWPNWTSVILRPESDESVPHYFRNYYLCHTRSIKDFKFFIQRPGVVDWTKPVVFTGIPFDLVGTIQEKSRKEQGEVTSVEHRFMYAWLKQEFPEQDEVPDGLKLTVLQEQHAEAVCDHWKHYRTNDGLVDYFRQVIRNFDSSAIITTDGRLAAYICMQFNGSMANLFVDPEFHTAKLGVMLLKDLTRKLLSKNQTAYGFIKTKDTSFINTCQNIGFSWVAQGSMSWVNFRPFHLKQNSGIPRVSSASVLPQQAAPREHDISSQLQDLHLNALPLSCNECSGIPVVNKLGCIHVSTS